MPNLLTLDLETPADAAPPEEPDGAAITSTSDAARPLPPPVLESLEALTASPSYPKPATTAEQPFALTEVNPGNPDTDPSTDNQSPTLFPSGSKPGALSSPTASPSTKVGVSAPTSPHPATRVPVTARSLSPDAQLHVHKARLQDARNIFDLVNSLSHDGTLLRRSYAEICENIRDFTVAETLAAPGTAPHFLGCGALHLYGPHLAEVRSIVVKPEAKGQGAGGKLLRALLTEADYQGVASVCLFTRIPDFFFHFGFRVSDRTALPDKIYKDCQTCPRLYACDEVAMVRGPLPRIAVLGPTKFPEPELVKLQTSVIPPPAPRHP